MHAVEHVIRLFDPSYNVSRIAARTRIVASPGSFPGITMLNHKLRGVVGRAVCGVCAIVPQIRAARALIRLSAQQLAKETAMGVTTIRRAELTASEAGQECGYKTVERNRLYRTIFRYKR